MILSITEIWDPILRKKTRDINLWLLNDYQKFFDNMIETLEIAWWVWLAAPQVMSLDSVFVIWVKPTKNYPNHKDNWAEVIINPSITLTSDEMIEWREWCLSIPWSTSTTWLKWKVPRYKRINVEYYSRKWEKIARKLSWFEAIVFQHEYDHLQGIMFLDRMETLDSLCTYEWFQKNK